MKIPAGTELTIGAPAKPMPAELCAGIGRALARVPAITEAHLPQCYGKGVIDPLAQILVLVLETDAHVAGIVRSVP